MSVQKIAGVSGKNSVTFFREDNNDGIKTIRKDGNIVTRKVNCTIRTKKVSRFLELVVLIFAFFRETVFLFNLPNWLYHVPTVIFSLLFVITLLPILKNSQLRKYHGAEHKVANWYQKYKGDINQLKKCSRIHLSCGTNLSSTILCFQIISSLSMFLCNFHIPEIITSALPFFVYNIFPFNILGLLMQLATTSEPTAAHIEVAMRALNRLVRSR